MSRMLSNLGLYLRSNTNGTHSLYANNSGIRLLEECPEDAYGKVRIKGIGKSHGLGGEEITHFQVWGSDVTLRRVKQKDGSEWWDVPAAVATDR